MTDTRKNFRLMDSSLSGFKRLIKQKIRSFFKKVSDICRPIHVYTDINTSVT